MTDVTLTLPPDDNDCTSQGCINFLLYEANPGTASGSINSAGDVTITDSFTVEVDVTTPLPFQCIAPQPAQITLTSTAPYDPSTGTMSLADSGFTIPNFNAQPSCGLAYPSLNAYPGGIAGSLGNALTMDLSGTLPLPIGAPTSTALSVSPSGSASGHQQVTLTATVTSGSTPVTAGQVEFYQGTTSLGTALVFAPNGQATYTFGAGTLTPGSYSFSATYLGDPPDYGSSQSAPLPYTINPPPPIYVSPSGTDSSSCGSSWASACATVHQAMNNSSAGQMVYVQGTIKDTVVIPARQVTISGAEASASAPAVIQGVSGGGSNAGSAITVSPGGTVTLDNLTIQGGSTANTYGGGVYNNGGTLTVNNSTITGGNPYGVYNTQYFGSGGTATINASTVSDSGTDTLGDLGGGIYNDGISLTVTGSVVTGNTGGSAVQTGQQGAGVYSAAPATISGSTISNNTASDGFGGGIYSIGALTMANSTVSGNMAEAGAGLYANDTTTDISGSTISGNTATLNPGGVGGGVYTVCGGLGTSASFTMTDSTVSNNTASGGSGSGGGIAAGGAGGGCLNLTLTADTIVGNTANQDGGISANGLTTIFTGTPTSAVGATIIANNTGGNCGGLGTLNSVGYNLTSDATGTACGFTQSTDIADANPQLGPLMNSGGLTQTMVPAASSPAAGAIPSGTTLNGVSVCPGTDQRGVSRPQPAGGNCTIGSVEVAPQATPSISSPAGATFTVGTSGTFTVQSYGNPTPALSESGTLPSGVTFTDNGDGTATISGTPASGTRGAYPITITAANSVGSTSQSFTLYVAQAVNTLYVAAGGSDTGNCQSSTSPCATITYALTQAGSGDTIQVSGTIDDHVTVPFPITITGANAPSSSPAVIDGGGTATVVKVPAGATVTLDHLGIQNGAASLNGGAGLNNAGDTTLTDSTVSANVAGFVAGGILNHAGGTLHVVRSTISSNTAGLGAGIENQGATLTVSNSTISGNTASSSGGAILNLGTATDPGTVSVVSSTIADNTAASGAGIDTEAGGLGASATFGASIVADNTGGNCAGAAPTSVGYNLTDDATGTACGFTQSTDLVNRDPGLATLANNGGPTETQKPNNASPALGVIPRDATVIVSGASVVLCPATDQRGVSRPQPPGGKCSIGAVEEAPAIDTSTTLSSSANPSAPGNVTFTATVKAASGGGTPSGTVAFIIDSGIYKPCVAATLHSGKATCTASFKASTTHSVRAAYGGDSSYSQSSSATLTQKVTTGSAKLTGGQTLTAGESLATGIYRVTMQKDGNLVETKSGKAIWSTKTSGHQGAGAVMQKDGNFAVYSQGKAIWSTGTSGHSGASLVLQASDGNLVVYAAGGKALWSAGT